MKGKWTMQRPLASSKCLFQRSFHNSLLQASAESFLSEALQPSKSVAVSYVNPHR